MIKRYKKLWVALVVLMLLSPLGLLATGTAFGEWAMDELLQEVGFIPAGLAKFADLWPYSLFPDYTVPGLSAGFLQSAIGYIISAMVGVILVAGVTMLFAKVVKE
ncbi:MAG: cobalamin biosynthesis protein [Syntrophomonadaceae bacterium]|nr:cobalamin biosynthesis protein [Syntrophomonadaceae bacterium]